MRPAERVYELMNRMRVTPRPEYDERVHGEINKAIAELKSTPTAVRQPSPWRTIMKSPVTKLAAAATVVVACVIGLSLWTGTQSGIALADVLARVEQVKTSRCKMSYTMKRQMAPGRPFRYENRWRIVGSREYGSKGNVDEPDPNGGWIPSMEFYLYPQKKMQIQITHAGKEYVRRELSDAAVQEQQKYSDPGAIIKEIMASNKYENLGRSTLDGVDVEGFRTTDPNFHWALNLPVFKNRQVDVNVWVGVKTRLPVRYESLTSGLDDTGDPMSHRFVVHDFEWDVPVTAADVEPPPVPDGYEVLDNPPTALGDEKPAIQGLRRCVELFGNYLETISDDTGAIRAIFLAFEKSETPAALRLKEEVEGLTEAEKLDRAWGWSGGGPIRDLLWFYVVGLVQEKKDPAYYGRTVTPKDADKVLLRWKLSDKEYRVVYGDLHAETVSPEKLAELEKDLPK